jgi:hypothetical protein
MPLSGQVLLWKQEGFLMLGQCPSPRNCRLSWCLLPSKGVRVPRKNFVFLWSVCRPRSAGAILALRRSGSRSCRRPIHTHVSFRTTQKKPRGHEEASIYRKETSRNWEQGDDRSLIDFQGAEYSDGKAVADQEDRETILKIGIRKTARETGIDTKTVMLICKGERVKPSTLAKLVEFVRTPRHSALAR